MNQPVGHWSGHPRQQEVTTSAADPNGLTRYQELSAARTVLLRALLSYDSRYAIHSGVTNVWYIAAADHADVPVGPLISTWWKGFAGLSGYRASAEKLLPRINR